MKTQHAAALLLAVVFTSACSDSSQNAEQAGMSLSKSDSRDLCLDAGPQTPRDISISMGQNTKLFELAPPATELSLCNIHTHTNAEHKGPGFSVFVGDGVDGGYACNDASSLTAEELLDPKKHGAAFKGVKPGNTIEVHWVHTSCDVTPGESLGSCLTDSCTDPVLRVEAQTFLVVNDSSALDFKQMTYEGTVRNNLHQAKSIPDTTGQPVVFHGSTTGPSYNQSTCSPFQVTWSVRPQCARIDISSLHEWAANGNIFNETKSHGVRQLVTAPELLAPIN